MRSPEKHRLDLGRNEHDVVVPHRVTRVCQQGVEQSFVDPSLGGQLSVAPEHVDEDVLDKMKKPGAESYERFAEMFACASKEAGKDQHLVPYYISGHPGSTLHSMIDLALYLKQRGLRPRQVQDFIPTPMSMATSMYVTGLDPFTRKRTFHPGIDISAPRTFRALPPSRNPPA